LCAGRKLKGELVGCEQTLEPLLAIEGNKSKIEPRDCVLADGYARFCTVLPSGV
jgi:hypothetical protein